MGIYLTMKYPNFQDAELLKDWNMGSEGIGCQNIYSGGILLSIQRRRIPTDFPFSIRPLDVCPHDWCTAFNIDPNSAEGVLITKTVQDLAKKEESYELDLLIGLVKMIRKAIM